MKMLLAILALLMPVAAHAQHPDFMSIREGQPVVLKPDRAYILFRMSTALSPFATEAAFLRERSPAEPGQGDPNVFPTVYDHPVFRAGPERAFLIEAIPGSYVLLGLSFEGSPVMNVCFCFGTVRFAAKAGVVTDMGYILVDQIGKVSNIPELAPVTGGREKISPDGPRLTGAIRPYADGMPVPPALAAVPRVPAEYRAVGRFPNSFAYSINRLPPMPGILAYDEDRVIDLKATD